MSGDEIETLNDPIADSTYKDIWQSTSRRNTHIITHVFPSSIMSSKEEKQKMIHKVLHENQPLPPQQSNDDAPNSTQAFASPSVASPSKSDSDYAFFGPSLSIPPSPGESSSKPKGLHETLKDRLDLDDDSSMIKKVEEEFTEEKSSVEMRSQHLGEEQKKKDGGEEDKEGDEETRRELSLEEMLKKLAELKGYLHDFPLDLFKEENLDLSPLTKESLVPKNVYT